jgi:sarcosine oxidase, subunit beta
MQAEFVIAGAGVVGASIAFHLAQRGCRDVLVLDRADDFGAGSTAKATGGFRAQFDNETEVRMSLLSREKLHSLESDTGVDSGYQPHGYLFLACNDNDLTILRDAQRVQHACGLHEARMVTADEARVLSPAAAGDASVIGGAFCPTDGFLRPMNVLRGYADAARRMGVRFAFGVELRELRSQGSRVVAAETSQGAVHGSVFINAMGAWAGAPVTPVRRNVAATVPTDVFDEPLPMTIWSGDWYHLRVRDGRVLLLWPDDPPVDDDAWLAEVLRKTRERVPLLADVAIGERRSGLYEMSPDEHALLGRSATYDNLYLATGSSGHGVMHAPATGQLLAELLIDDATSIDISALSPARFTR